MKKRMKLLLAVVTIGLSILISCSVFTSSPTISTPVTSITPTLIPTPSIYTSEMDFSFLYPSGWYYWSSDEGLLRIANKENLQPKKGPYNDGEIVMELINVLPDTPAGFGDPLKALSFWTDNLGIKMPDQEPVHTVNLRGRDFMIGTYSEEYIHTTWHGNRVPLFVAVYVTDINTIIVDMYAGPGDKLQLRKVFEDLLTSIEDKP